MSALERVKNHHKLAFDYISKALQIDEDPEAKKNEAVEWYIQGIEEIEKGVCEQCVGASQEDKIKAGRIQAKMKKNLEMASERLAILCSNSENKPSNMNSSSVHRKSASASSSRPLSDNARDTPSPTDSISNKAHVPRKITNERKPWNYSPSPKPPRPKVIKSSKPTYSTTVSKRETGQSSLCDRINLKNVPKEMVNRILDELVEPGSHTICLDDVAGQETAKQALREIVIFPALRPEFFTGLRTPARGLLLFGPPGTGKTLLAKAVAAEAKSNFFNISASTLTSKWVGEGEKMVKALFAVAKEVQPSVIFIDEIDSLLSERKEGESDSTRRLKTEFMLRFDGVESQVGDRILVMGATNRPQELDDAVLRRFSKRVYVSLPDEQARVELLGMLLKKQNSPLSKSDILKLSQQTEFYSGSDLTELAKDAALGPVREISQDELVRIDVKKMRPIQYRDFVNSLKKIRPSVSKKLLSVYEEWNSDFGDNS